MGGLRFSALVLAGGRSSRLGGSSKALLSDGSQTLLGAVLAACGQAELRVVVGPEGVRLPAGTLLTREDPPFSGPAAAISAGLDCLVRALGFEAGRGAELDRLVEGEHWVLVLSCDLPRARAAVPYLLRAAASAPASVTGYRAVAGQTPQHLLGIYRLGALCEAFAGETANASVRRFLEPLAPLDVDVPADVVQDVDTWQDAAASGFYVPTAPSQVSAPVEKQVTWQGARALMYTWGRQGAGRRLTLPLDQAIGHITAEPVRTLLPVPHYDSSAMDGFAVAGAPPWQLLEAPEVEADANQHRQARPLAAGQATPILTGGLIPAGTEAIIRQEHAQQTQDAQGRPLLEPLPAFFSPDQPAPKPGADIRRTGEELSAQALVTGEGSPVTARLAAALATLGHDRVTVYDRPTLALAFTGNEVITSGLPEPGQVRDAYSPALPALIDQLGGQVISSHRLPDTREAFTSWLSQTEADLLILTGGSSTSSADWARRALADLDATYLFESVMIRPGHPALAARLPQSANPASPLVLGLPGNPLAAYTALYSYLAPWLAGRTGQPLANLPTGVLTQAVPGYRKAHPRLVPAALELGPAGVHLTPLPKAQSHMLSSFAQAGALALIPAEGASTSTPVTYLPLR